MYKDYVKEMQELVNAKPPIIVEVSNDGRLLSASYETSWKEGGTTPIVKKGVVTGYEENYQLFELTQNEIDQLDAYIATNISS